MENQSLVANKQDNAVKVSFYITYFEALSLSSFGLIFSISNFGLNLGSKYTRALKYGRLAFFFLDLNCKI